MLFQEFTLENPANLNASLFSRFMALSTEGRVRQSYHFAGRFENIYIDRDDIPEINALLTIVRAHAAELLAVEPAALKTGFWFNAMASGNRTSLHHHDENDELLSAVYYIRVPDDSGALVLHDGDVQTVVQPCAGKLVMFAPDVPHEVTVNNSEEMRLSVAFNVGPVGG
jgi:hypothetical protein